MNVLVIGSGAREHALAWAISKSPSLKRLFVAPGNPGCSEIALNISLSLDDHEGVRQFCVNQNIDLVVIGPEAPLVAGLVDLLAKAGIVAFGPTRAAAQLEGSKGFTKDLCSDLHIPTARYRRCSDRTSALAYLREQSAPIVVKADGLAAGKGVVVAETESEAQCAVDAIYRDDPTAACVLEERLEGEEVSLFALCDGARAVYFGDARDHKRVADGDQGPNTGGMGAYSPAVALSDDLRRLAFAEIIEPAIRGMRERGMPFKGVLFAGLMLTASGPKLIEFNVRFGDPETQALMLRLGEDILPWLHGASSGRLPDGEPNFSRNPALAVVVAANGYPASPVRGTEIRGLERVAAIDGVTVFQAATRYAEGKLLSDGGRVLSICASASDLSEARNRAYSAINALDWPEGFCRRDIGLQRR